MLPTKQRTASGQKSAMISPIEAARLLEHQPLPGVQGQGIRRVSRASLYLVVILLQLFDHV